MTLKLRDYQDFAVNSVFDYYIKGNRGNPVIAAPTGVGKSIIIAEFIRRTLFKWPDQRIMMLTHVQELIEQNYDKLKQIWPNAPAGIFSAGLGRKEHHYPITYAGIQSVHRHADKFGVINVVLVDEAHTIPTKDNTMYQKFLEALRKRNPYIIVIGLTATAYRTGSGMITEGEGSIFTDICCDMTTLEAFNWFLDQGYLSWLLPKPTGVVLDLSDVKTTGGDYNQGQLQELTDKEHITKKAVSEMIAVATEQNRTRWLIFGTGTDHVDHIVEEINSRGYRAVGVHSKMSPDERTANISRFKAGYVDALVNMGVLTTGFDCPEVDLIGVLRATKSPGLWVQILGRGTRPCYAPGYDLTTPAGRLAAMAASQKPNCLVMDFAGNTERLGCINDVVIPKRKKKKGGDAPVRLCEGCRTYIHASLIRCPHCGHEYPPEVKFGEEASDSKLIAKKRKADMILVHTFPVDSVYYQRYAGRIGNPDFIQVCYMSGYRRFTTPLCVEHTQSGARHLAHEWWRRACPDADKPGGIPDTVQQGLDMLADGCAMVPKFIRVHVNCKPYPKVLYVDYSGELAGEAELGERDVSFSG